MSTNGRHPLNVEIAESADLGAQPAMAAVSPRFTWYTAGLAGFFVFFALLTSHIPQQNPQPFSVGANVFVIVFEWFLFYLTYKGIRASGSSLGDIIGERWSSLREVWTDLALALTVFFLIWAAEYAVTHFGLHFPPSMSDHPKTIPHYVLVLIGALSAGFYEEITFRGLFLRQSYLLTRNMPAAVVSQSLVFALGHPTGQQSLARFLTLFFSGCLFAALTIQRKSLLPAILAHCLLDGIAVTVMFLTR